MIDRFCSMPPRREITKRKRDDIIDPYDLVPAVSPYARHGGGPVPDDYTDPRFVTLDMDAMQKLVRLRQPRLESL